MSSDRSAELSARGWFLRGMRVLGSIPGLILMSSFIGFGALCRESGLTLAQSVFITATMWALPGQVILVGAVAAGATLPAVALAVTLSSIRLAPMVAAWVPLMDRERTSRWLLLVLSHFVAVTSWVVALLRMPYMPAAARLPFFAGMGITLTVANTIVTAVSYSLSAQLPLVLAGALFFLTPVYFLISMTAASKLAAERIALLAGMLSGPVFHYYQVPLGLVWSGLVAGALGFAAHLLLRRAA
ncbi:AzlC family ABC transporter permease [Propylenella binzhouense]|uniref:Branched-chain amino acid ABC transporter permease n=1 Tax=Propylenella binzhouense TaxID=2555902 RepID=A0A964T1F2_9HYPH|nr:AzlC family ABC transporter permease [Propylenella binzhouense]MYZ46661.1 branched-chain amino acid ABC transporter permease [Propylenella binzhouense]